MEVKAVDIRNIIKNAGVSEDLAQLANDGSLKEIGLDSLDMANVLLQIEEKFNIKIPDEDVEQLDSINSIVAYIQEA